MIPFNLPPVVGTEASYVRDAIENKKKLCGGGFYTKACESWLEQQLSIHKALLTPSCTAALEMTALLINIQPGDEVIMPSYTFVSTANAFVLRGAKIVFIDVCPNTMNMNAQLIESAITTKTKAIVVVHYAGVACDMHTVMDVADRYNLYVIEDAAQALMSTYEGKPLGSIAHFGCFSFHETKNYTAGGEGGALLINDKCFIEQAEILREKGTDRSLFLKGQVDKYTWRDVGSSYLPSELQAAYLLAQLEFAQEINEKRYSIWSRYHKALFNLEREGIINRPQIPSNCQHNSHMYYIKLRSLSERSKFIEGMKNSGVQTMFHYVPLHSSPAGLNFGRFYGDDNYTTSDSERLVRLPLWLNMTDVDVDKVIEHCLLSFSEA